MHSKLDSKYWQFSAICICQDNFCSNLNCLHNCNSLLFMTQLFLGPTVYPMILFRQNPFSWIIASISRHWKLCRELHFHRSLKLTQRRVVLYKVCEACEETEDWWRKWFHCFSFHSCAVLLSPAAALQSRVFLRQVKQHWRIYANC